MFKFYRQLKYLKSILNADLLLYTMGKTGSNSLSYSLEEKGLTVGSKHYFGGDQQHSFVNEKKGLSGKVSKFIVRLLLKSTSRKVKIITLVRDPIARNLSMTFFSLDRIIYKTLRVVPNGQLAGKYLSLNEIIERGFRDILNHEGPLTYFDQEFKNVLDIDVFEHPFDKEKGYTIIQKGNLDLLILKLEKLAELDEVIQSFLNLNSFKLLTANSGDKYWYAALYKDFKNYFNPTENYLDKMYSSKFATHFYSQEEIARFRSRWTKKEVV